MVGQANGAQGGRMMQRLTQPRVFSFISRVETVCPQQPLGALVNQGPLFHTYGMTYTMAITHNAPGFSNLMVHHGVKSYFPLLLSKRCTQSFNLGRR